MFSSENVHFTIQSVSLKLGNLFTFSVLPAHLCEPALLFLLAGSFRYVGIVLW